MPVGLPKSDGGACFGLFADDLFSLSGPGRPWMARGDDASARLLRACSMACSRWFMAMRGAVRRARSASAEGSPCAGPSERESSVADMAESVLRSLFGDGPADYAREKYERAVASGDMRAFKIRLIVIRARDSLRGTELHRPFADGMEDCISSAEKDAGCVPDPSPRRMSRKEREKALRRSRIDERQMLLGLPPAQEEKPHAEYEDGQSQGSSAEGCTGDEDLCHRGMDDALEGASAENDICSYEHNAHKRGVEVVKCENSLIISNNKDKDSDFFRYENKSIVTVTRAPKKPDSYGNAYGKIKTENRFDSVDQILDGINNGIIEPYESEDDICADLARGLISPLDAFMLIAAMSQYSESPEKGDEDEEEEYDLGSGFGHEYGYDEWEGRGLSRDLCCSGSGSCGEDWDGDGDGEW